MEKDKNSKKVNLIDKTIIIEDAEDIKFNEIMNKLLITYDKLWRELAK